MDGLTVVNKTIISPERKQTKSAKNGCTWIFCNVFFSMDCTPLKINMEHNHGCLEAHVPV